MQPLFDKNRKWDVGNSLVVDGYKKQFGFLFPEENVLQLPGLPPTSCTALYHALLEDDPARQMRILATDNAIEVENLVAERMKSRVQGACEKCRCVDSQRITMALYFAANPRCLAHLYALCKGRKVVYVRGNDTFWGVFVHGEEGYGCNIQGLLFQEALTVFSRALRNGGQASYPIPNLVHFKLCGEKIFFDLCKIILDRQIRDVYSAPMEQRGTLL